MMVKGYRLLKSVMILLVLMISHQFGLGQEPLLNLQVVKRIDSIPPIFNLTIVDHRAYALCDAGLIIYDLTQPDNPSHLGSYSLPKRPNRLAVADNRAYIIDGSHELLILDVNDPTSITPLGKYTSFFYSFRNAIRDLALGKDVVYLAASSNGLEIIDVSNPMNPSLTSKTRITDTTNALNPEHLDEEIILPVLSVAHQNNQVYVGGEWTEKSDFKGLGGYYFPFHLRAFDVSNPAKPVMTHSGPECYEYMERIFIFGRMCFIVQVGGIDLSNGYSIPANICQVDLKSSSFSKGTRRFEYIDNDRLDMASSHHNKLIYIANDAGLRVYDFTYPNDPIKMGLYTSNQAASTVAISEDSLIYLGYTAGGMSILRYTGPDPRNAAQSMWTLYQ